MLLEPSIHGSRLSSASVNQTATRFGGDPTSCKCPGKLCTRFRSMDDSILNRKRRTFRWPAVARELVEANLKATGFQLRQLVTQLLEMTGYPRSACRRFIQRMGNTAKSLYKRWPASEQERLLELLDKH